MLYTHGVKRENVESTKYGASKTARSPRICNAKQGTVNGQRGRRRERETTSDNSENGDEILYPVPRVLSDTLCYPSQGPNLLLFQPKVAVKYSVIELLQECLLVQVDFLDEEPIFEFADGLGLFTTERELSEEV